VSAEEKREAIVMAANNCDMKILALLVDEGLPADIAGFACSNLYISAIYHDRVDLMAVALILGDCSDWMEDDPEQGRGMSAFNSKISEFLKGLSAMQPEKKEFKWHGHTYRQSPDKGRYERVI
jgi:hypothetical protein